jgi:hypothetical protein
MHIGLPTPTLMEPSQPQRELCGVHVDPLNELDAPALQLAISMREAARWQLGRWPTVATSWRQAQQDPGGA